MHHHAWGTRCLTRILAAVLLLALPLTGAAADRVAAWNVTAVDATLMAGENPTVQSRALAAIQAAVHDALNAIDRRFAPYAFHGEVDPDASPDAAVATAAHDALVGVIAVGTLPFAGFGTAAQQNAAVAFVDATYAADLETIPEGEAKTRGIAVGQAAAAAILAERQDDGATTVVPYTPGTEPGDWQPTPNPSPAESAGGRRPPARRVARVGPGDPLRAAVQRPVPAGRPPGPHQRGLCARLPGGAGDWRQGQRGAHRRPGGDRALLVREFPRRLESDRADHRGGPGSWTPGRRRGCSRWSTSRWPTA